MTDPQLGVLMLIMFVGLIMLGFPIAFTLMAMAVGFAYLAFDGNWEPVMSLLVQRTWSVMTNDILISVPLFVFMGYIIERANILDRLFRSIQLAAGGLPGSLAVATLITCTLFATAGGGSGRPGDVCAGDVLVWVQGAGDAPAVPWLHFNGDTGMVSQRRGFALCGLCGTQAWVSQRHVRIHALVMPCVR